MANSEKGLYIEGFNAISKIKNLSIVIDGSTIRNRVYVRGGTYLSDEFTFSQVADGEQTVFYLPEKPHEISIAEGVTAKTVGIKNVDSFDDYDYLLNFQEKYIETEVAPASGTVINTTYKYDIPVLVALQDDDSIDLYGQFEYVIFDNNIRTTTLARQRAEAELEGYAYPVITISFVTMETGFGIGQHFEFEHNLLDVADNFSIQQITSKSLGGGMFEYSITANNSDNIGIIKFLTSLIDSDKQSLNISGDEVVDEITTIDGESYTFTAGTPSITKKSTPYHYDSGDDWNVAGWY